MTPGNVLQSTAAALQKKELERGKTRTETSGGTQTGRPNETHPDKASEGWRNVQVRDLRHLLQGGCLPPTRWSSDTGWKTAGR